ncbi:hypothetical protein C7M84_012416 [Penaeus vannamei]|uniref:Uncharacterized protein n=1 Tax=Penaeus vannamei TaxID=6689 RepID=A0A3R7Q416_PENVA|nr:hypothetical protein C7M84_012416 [Penaeus vannamei]
MPLAFAWSSSVRFVGASLPSCRRSVPRRWALLARVLLVLRLQTKTHAQSHVHANKWTHPPPWPPYPAAYPLPAPAYPPLPLLLPPSHSPSLLPSLSHSPFFTRIFFFFTPLTGAPSLLRPPFLFTGRGVRSPLKLFVYGLCLRCVTPPVPRAECARRSRPRLAAPGECLGCLAALALVTCACCTFRGSSVLYVLLLAVWFFRSFSRFPSLFFSTLPSSSLHSSFPSHPILSLPFPSFLSFFPSIPPSLSSLSLSFSSLLLSLLPLFCFVLREGSKRGPLFLPGRWEVLVFTPFLPPLLLPPFPFPPFLLSSSPAILPLLPLSPPSQCRVQAESESSLTEAARAPLFTFRLPGAMNPAPATCPGRCAPPTCPRPRRLRAARVLSRPCAF